MEPIEQLAAELFSLGEFSATAGYAQIKEGRYGSTWYIGSDTEGVIAKLFAPDQRRRAANFQSALAHAAAAGLSPRPLALAGAKEVNAVLYRYVPGPRLDEAGGSLPSIYGVLGQLTARLHRCFANLPTAPFPAPDGKAGEGHQVLHGDVNATNLIGRDDRALFVDFEDVGVGPVERDLALALSNVNTSRAEFGDCLRMLHRGYTASGGRCDERQLMREILQAPRYILGKQTELVPSSASIARPVARRQYDFLVDSLTAAGLLQADEALPFAP